MLGFMDVVKFVLCIFKDFVVEKRVVELPSAVSFNTIPY